MAGPGGAVFKLIFNPCFLFLGVLQLRTTSLLVPYRADEFLVCFNIGLCSLDKTTN